MFLILLWASVVAGRRLPDQTEFLIEDVNVHNAGRGQWRRLYPEDIFPFLDVEDGFTHQLVRSIAHQIAREGFYANREPGCVADGSWDYLYGYADRQEMCFQNFLTEDYEYHYAVESSYLNRLMSPFPD